MAIPIRVPLTTELTYTLTTRIEDNPTPHLAPGCYVLAIYGLNGVEHERLLFGPIEPPERAVELANSIKDYHRKVIDGVAQMVYANFNWKAD